MSSKTIIFASRLAVLSVAAATLAISGCGQGQQEPTPQATAAKKQRDALDAKLATMTPTERRDYFQSNPDAMKSYGGGGVSSKPGR